MADAPIPDLNLEIVYPSPEIIASRKAEIQRYVPGWASSIGYLIIKPTHEIVVALERIECDDFDFQLCLGLKQVIHAPADFNPAAPLSVVCAWNQPYMSLEAECVNAPYSFRLLFGAQAEKRLRR